tara:strand:+ start:748 stop:960 length:213 start_codon:yes stop_codon:yes gene_type:complete
MSNVAAACRWMMKNTPLGKVVNGKVDKDFKNSQCRAREQQKIRRKLARKERDITNNRIAAGAFGRLKLKF